MKLLRTLILPILGLTFWSGQLQAQVYMLDEVGSTSVSSLRPQMRAEDFSSVSLPRRYFSQNNQIDEAAYRKFLDLYSQFKDHPKLAKSKKALQRALGFFAKNKDHIPRKCGGDLKANRSPRGAKLDAIEGIDNQRYILITDYTIPLGGGDRFFVLDLQDGSVDSCPAAHGYGSDRNCPKGKRVNCGSRGTKCRVPTAIGNSPGSGVTSRGFYITDEGYRSGQGTFRGGSPRSVGVNALNMRGLIGGVNDKALARSVVWHRASYAGNTCSRSAGCPAVCPKLFEKYKDKVKRSLMYIHTLEDEKLKQPDC